MASNTFYDGMTIDEVVGILEKELDAHAETKASLAEANVKESAMKGTLNTTERELATKKSAEYSITRQLHDAKFALKTCDKDRKAAERAQSTAQTKLSAAKDKIEQLTKDNQ